MSRETAVLRGRQAALAGGGMSETSVLAAGRAAALARMTDVTVPVWTAKR